MLIQIMYPGNKYDYVKESILDKLIDNGDIVRFKRTSGWVSLGVDRVREGNEPYFNNGAEDREFQDNSTSGTVTKLRLVQ